jgi:hypothetical protein
MTPSADWKEQNRLAHRANASIERAFALFIALTASRACESPESTFKEVEASMDVWAPYEDRNRMELPDYPAPPLPVLPITAYAIISEHGPHGLEIHQDLNKRLGIFEFRSDADRTVSQLAGDSWKVVEVQGRFANLDLALNPPARKEPA